MKENKPTFEEYCNQPAYPQIVDAFPMYWMAKTKGDPPEEIPYRKERCGLTKLEAFTKDILKAGLSFNNSVTTEECIGKAKIILKALYDEQWGGKE